MKKRKVRNRMRKAKRKSTWQESLDYLRGTQRQIYFIVILFLLSSFIGFAFPNHFTGFNDLLRGLTDKIDTLSLTGLMWFIFQNNVSSAFAGMILGILFGIMPVVNTLLNGVLLGYVYALASAQGGYGVIWLLVPHGIFELPAVFISLGLGVRLGMFAFAKKGYRLKEFKERFWNSLKVFIYVVLPLLVIAAVIEGILIFVGR